MTQSIARVPHAQQVAVAADQSFELGGDRFAEQLALSRAHPRLVPMLRQGIGYVIDPSADSWQRLPQERGFAGFGLRHGMRMLLDVLGGLQALHQTRESSGAAFAHGEVALLHFRIDPRGVCRLVPLTMRHSVGWGADLPNAVLRYASPERLIGEPIGALADVFSAGILLWEGLACRRLFNESNAEAIIKRMMAGELELPEVPECFSWAAPLKPLLRRALYINQQRRQLDCTALRDAIERATLDRLPSHDEMVAFFAAMSVPSAAPTHDPAGSGSAPHEHASSTRPTERGAHLMSAPRALRRIKQSSSALRFTTVRMSAVQLRNNGLFDSDSPETAISLKASSQRPPPPSSVRFPGVGRAPAALAPLAEEAGSNEAPASQSAPVSSASPPPLRRTLPPPLPPRRTLPPPPLAPRRTPLPVLPIFETAPAPIIEPLVLTAAAPQEPASTELDPDPHLRISRPVAWVLSAIAGALTGLVTAMALLSTGASNAVPPRAAGREPPRLSAPVVARTVAPVVSAHPEASCVVPNKLETGPAPTTSASARASAVRPERQKPSPSEPATGEAATRASSAGRALRDYGI